MLNSLRNRLLASYLAIILVTLGMIGLALLVFLRTQPLPTDEVVRDLAASLIDVHVTGTWQLETNLSLDSLDEPPTPLRMAVTGVSAYLEDQAAERDVRTLIVDENGLVFFDSSKAFSPRQQISDFARRPLSHARRSGMNLSQVYQGEFIDPDGTEWIYVAQPFSPFISLLQNRLSALNNSELSELGNLALWLATHPVTSGSDSSPGGMGNGMMGRDAQMINTLYVLVAQPTPQPTLREVFRLFGESFFSPLARAGVVGALIALVLAALIARSVARPLQYMSTAAGQIAQGDFSTRVPVNGPHEVRTLADSFNSMARQVATTQQAQRDFLANVSHDLRTPLTSIQGFSQAIAEGVAADPESARHAAQIIHDEAGRLHRLVEELLDLARIEAGQADMRRGSVQVGDVLRAISDSLSVKAREKSLQIDLATEESLPRIAGDADRLAQVFTNLIDNAIKHTPDGGKVTVSAKAERDHLLVIVSDTGPGIPAEDLPRVFERFYQVDKSRQRQPRDGVGLGLAIARQIVEAHGGSLEVSSVEGCGATFTVRLPISAR